MKKGKRTYEEEIQMEIRYIQSENKYKRRYI